MRIGIDFDNTIVCYDNVFYYAALEKGLIPKNLQKSKQSVRDYLRSVDKEDEWIELQGYVYGRRLDLAKPFKGVCDFFKKSKKKNIEIFIISHKTLNPFKGPKYNLHEAAKCWLLNQSFYNEKIASHFELTLEEKLNRINLTNCDYFIDDLPELLREGKFPKSTKKILFDPNNLHQDSIGYMRFCSWKELSSFF